MPADDLILNVRQIAGYPNVGGAAPSDTLVLQRGGLGGPYVSVEAAAFAETALIDGGPLPVGVLPPDDADPGQVFTDLICLSTEETVGFNAYMAAPGTINYWTSGPACYFSFGEDGVLWQMYPDGPAGGVIDPNSRTGTVRLTPVGGLTIDDTVTLGRAPIGPTEAASAGWVDFAIANAVAGMVPSVNGRTGPITLSLWDIPGAAPIFSPRFTGFPRAPTPAFADSSSAIATTAWVQRHTVMSLNCLLVDQPFVFTFNGRSGHIVLSASDFANIEGVFNDVELTGVPSAPTAAPDTATDQIATTAFVAQAIADASDIFATIDSPIFTGYPSAPTAAPGASTAQIATTAFVMNAVADSVAGVATFNGRSGNVVLTDADVSGAGGALLASPAFTGAPTAPTAAPGTANTTIATTAYVAAAIAAATGVATFNGRTGAITLTAADVTSAGGALLASPIFTGTPAGPTASPGTATTQLATTAFVAAAIAGYVSSFNGRGGAITLTANDVSAAGALVNPSPALTGVPTAPTAATATSTTQIATTAFVYAALATAGGVDSFNGRAGNVTLTQADITGAGGALASALANYLPLAGGTLTGNVTITPPAATSAVLTLNKPASGQACQIWGEMAGLDRWLIALGDSVAESGSNVGSNLTINSYTDAGALLTTPLQMTRAGQLWATLGPLIVAKSGSSALNNQTGMSYATSNGLLVETTGAAQNFSLNRSAAGNVAIFYFGGTGVGTIGVTSTGTSFNTTSDARMKRDVRDFDAGPILDGIEVWDFAWQRSGRRAHGVMAQDVYEVYPDAVMLDETSDTWFTDYSKFVPLLLQEVKALRSRVAALEARS